MKIVRKVGIGDLMHVRNGLLSVGIISRTCLPEQFDGACMAGDVLGMMVRGHVLCGIEGTTQVEKVLYRHAYHQVLTYDLPEVPAWNDLDLVIHLEPEEIVTAQQVMRVTINTWNQYGGRFARGNHGRSDAATLARIHLDGHIDSTDHEGRCS